MLLSIMKNKRIMSIMKNSKHSWFYKDKKEENHFIVDPKKVIFQQ